MFPSHLFVTLFNLTVNSRNVSQPSVQNASYVIDSMLQYDRQMQSPTIEPYVNQYTLSKGASATFRCVSPGAISWYRKESLPWTSTELASCAEADNTHCGSVTFSNASIEQVGRYYCAKDAEVRQYREQYGWSDNATLRQYLADLEGEFLATSFYLFVHDPERSLVSGDTVISFGHVQVIPCKPTSPLVETDVLDVYGRPVPGVYTSTDGLVLSNGRFPKESTILCADRFANREDVLAKATKLRKRSYAYENKPFLLSTDVYVIPFLTSKSFGYIYELDSQVTATYNTVPLGAEVHIVCGLSLCRWDRKAMNIIPPVSLPQEAYTERITRFKSKVARCDDVVIHELIIRMALPCYSGTFRCEANGTGAGDSEPTTFSSIKLLVLSSLEDFLHFAEGNADSTIRIPKLEGNSSHQRAKPVTVGINYEYYSANVSCVWYRDGTKIEGQPCANCSGRYEILHRWKRESLTILRPTIWESGRYTVECSVGNGIKRNTSRDVFIEGDWDVRMLPDRLEIVPSNPIEMVCRSRGVKTAQFELKFIECESQLWEECKASHPAEKAKVISISGSDTPFEVYYAFRTTPEMSGILVCEVSTEELGKKSTETIVENQKQLESEARTSLNRQIITASLLFATLMVLLSVTLVWSYRKYTERKRSLVGDPNAEGLAFLPDVYRIAREKVQLYELLGRGEFGVTWKAITTGVSEDASLETVVAVKEPRERNDRQMMSMLLSELRTHVHAGHHVNVVNLLGAVVENVDQGELMLIMEYCRFGNLQVFLQQNRQLFRDNIDDGLFGVSPPDEGPSTSTSGGRYPFSKCDLLWWACQIACGMDYLATSGLIHGDLAARNVLLCDGGIVKICDFGLARVTRRDDVYRKTGDERLPVAWMAVESIRDRLFSTSSDVWAYGVLLWELFALGAEPYSMIMVNETLLNMLEQGYRLQHPESAPREVYSIMCSCWDAEAAARPTFKNLYTEFNNTLPARLRKQYARLNEPYVFMNKRLEEMGSHRTPLHIYVNESVLVANRMSAIGIESDNDTGETVAVVIRKPRMQPPDISESDI